MVVNKNAESSWWRRWRYRILAVVALSGAAKLGLALWLLRDPEPVFAARQGTLAAVEARPAVRDGAMLDQEIVLTSTSGLTFEIAVRSPVAARPVGGAPAGSGGQAAQSETAPTARRQLFLILGGHSRGKGAGALIADTHGSIVASLEYPFDGDHAATGWGALAQIPAIRRALYATPPAVSLALDHLLTRPDVDPARVELVGASFGAPFATIAAARDPRVTRLWLAHGGGDVYGLIAQGLQREIAFTPLRMGAAALGTLLISGPRFAPEVWIGRVAPRPVVMLNAEEDEKIPRRSVEVLWEAAREPKELVWLPGPHMQGSRPEVLERLVSEVMRRAARMPGVGIEPTWELPPGGF